MSWIDELENEEEQVVNTGYEAFLLEAEEHRAELLNEFSEFSIEEFPVASMAHMYAYWEWHFKLSKNSIPVNVSILVEHFGEPEEQVWQVEIGLQSTIFSAAGVSSSAVQDAFKTLYKLFATHVAWELEGELDGD